MHNNLLPSQIRGLGFALHPNQASLATPVSCATNHKNQPDVASRKTAQGKSSKAGAPHFVQIFTGEPWQYNERDTMVVLICARRRVAPSPALQLFFSIFSFTASLSTFTFLLRSFPLLPPPPILTPLSSSQTQPTSLHSNSLSDGICPASAVEFRFHKYNFNKYQTQQPRKIKPLGSHHTHRPPKGAIPQHARCLVKLGKDYL